MHCPLSFNSSHYSEHLALRWGRRSITWEHLDACVHSTSRTLKECGLKKGSRIALLSQVNPESIIILLAAWRSGICVMPLNPRLPEKIRSLAIMEFAPACLLTSAEYSDLHPGLRHMLLNRTVTFEHTDSFLGRAGLIDPEIPDDLAAAVILTSGSSGSPKGVLLTYGQLYSSAIASCSIIPFTVDDSWLLSLPLWHVSGLAILFRALTGGGCVLCPEPDASLADMLIKFGPTHASLVPLQLHTLQQSPAAMAVLSKARAVLLGGGPVPDDLVRIAVSKGIELYVTYGMTEGASQIATGKVGPDATVFVRALPDREIMISNSGEILVRGPGIFTGYCFGGPAIATNPDGWFATGDSGQMLAGSLKVNGRCDNMFVCGGENVYPEHIEKVLLEHPSVAAVCVVPYPDRDYGQRPAAFISFRNEGVRDLAAIRQFIRPWLAAFEIPTRFYAWPDTVASNQIKFDRSYFKLCSSPTEIH